MIQIARAIYLEQLAVMKKLLDLMAFKLDKRTSEYKYIKSQVMDYFYNGMTKLFKKMEEEKIITKCSCNHSLRKGYSPCSCGGSGWINNENKIDKK